MKIKAIIIFLLLSYISVSSYAQQKTAEVTYVGNSGFLINIGDKKILIDALFKGFAGDYNLPEHIQEKLRLAQAPFDDVDLILVTHAHGDHIDPRMVKEHMKNNPKAIFASTKQTVDALNARDTLDNFHERRIGFNPSKEKSDKKDIKGISIESFYLPHGPDSRIINNGFLVSVNGITLFHTGDVDYDQFTYEEFQSYQLPERKIDLSFIQHFYLTSDSISRQFVTKGIGGKYIIPIHYHFTTPPFDSLIIKQNYPDAILFDKELESWKMPDKNDETPTLTGYYFNQLPPSDSAIIFAPGFFSLPSRLESNIALSPDGKECYFGILEIKDNKASYKIYQSKYVNNKWTDQTEAPFSINNNISDPILSADGKKLYFSKEGNIWMLERSLEGWGEPQLLPSPINSDSRDGSYTETADGDIYISSRRKGGFGGIDNWRINRLADQSLQAENLGPIMNSKYFDYSPFIAPDGSYLIFGSYRARRDGLLYISFNKGNDDWTTPINMNSCGAKVNNTTAHHSNPSLSPDGKYLFFRRHANMMEMDVYWVSTGILKKLKEKAMQESSPQKFTDLKGDYLGQTPPDDVPVIFAPGIVSVNGRYEFAVSFTPDLEEIYFTAKRKGESSSIYFSKLIDKKWTNPKKANLTKGKKGEMEAFVNFSGEKIYFTASDSKGVKIWCASRSENWWNDAIELDSPINNDMVFYSNEAENGDLFYKNVSKGKMYYAPNKNGKFPEVFEVGIEYGSHGFIAPSQDFMLIDALKDKDNDKTKDKGIHVCFKKKDGTWTKPINLGSEVNSNFNETCPSITPDGKYLFFSRYNEEGGLPNIYWVSANIIKKLKEKTMQEDPPQKFTNLKGDYLGQTPPGDVPVIFAPGIVSTNTTIEHGSPTFSPDGNEVFWQANSLDHAIIHCLTMKRIKNVWTAPKISPYDSSPVFSPDGKRLYYLPFGEENGEKDGPHFVEKEGDHWSSPVCMDLIKHFPEIKAIYNHSFTNSGTLYFLGYAKGYWNNFGIYRSELIDGKYTQPELLPASINIPGNIRNWTPFIAPDESYLLFSSSRCKDKTDTGDIYISFRNSDGNWTKPVYLNDKINSEQPERFPSVTPDGKYLFFSRFVSEDNEDIIWVSAEIIDRLRKKIIK